MVPSSTLITVRDDDRPGHRQPLQHVPIRRDQRQHRAGHQLRPGHRASWNSSAEQELPRGMGIEWTELTYQQIEAGKDLLTKLVFPLAVLFVFLVLAAQYESWSLPLAIILIVPMCLLAAITGIWLIEPGQQHLHADRPGGAGRPGGQERHPDRRVRQAAAGRGRSTLSRPRWRPAGMRLRPILMTSFAFILGVVPLVLAKGAGAEMRAALGVAGVQRHAGRDLLRHLLHAGVLCRSSAG